MATRTAPAQRLAGGPAITAAELLAMLRRHHGLTGEPEAWAGGTLVHEVSANGPAGDGRRADALYLVYTAASGRCLIGYEIKVSRADWRREISRVTGKADQWADECHEWWIVVADPAIVEDGELPQGWGLMSPATGTDHRMTVHVRADRKRDHTPSWDTMRSIMSRLETLRAQTIKAQLWQITLEARRRAREEIEAEFAKRRTPDTAELHRRLNLIEDALGARIQWGDRPHIPGVEITDLAHIGAATRQYGNITAAVDAITGRFQGPLTATRSQLDHLERELSDLRACAPGHQESDAVSGSEHERHR